MDSYKLMSTANPGLGRKYALLIFCVWPIYEHLGDKYSTERRTGGELIMWRCFRQRFSISGSAFVERDLRYCLLYS
jgi:hypothetical protein